MESTRDRESQSGALYVVFAALLTIAVCFLWFLASLNAEPPSTLTLEWLTIGALVPAAVYYLIRKRRSYALALEPKSFRLAIGAFEVNATLLRSINLAKEAGHLLQIAAAALLLLVSLSLATEQKQLSLLLLAIAHFSIFTAVFPRRLWSRDSLCIFAWFFVVAWPMTAGLSYTRLSNLLTDLTPSLGLALFAFVAALWFVTADVAKSFYQCHPGRKARYHTIAWTLVATAIFLELSLNTKGLLADWIPYHRDFWVEPAIFVRQGHWLLWDVPSQYGFLSELLLALLPVRTVWTALYLLTAAALLIQATILFSVLYRSHSKWHDGLLPLCICLSVFFSAQASRVPYGPRLYPQEGLRTLWPLILVYIAWCVYKNLDAGQRVRAATLRWLGHIAWVCACLWSFETAIWSSLIWFTFLLCLIFVDTQTHSVKDAFQRAAHAVAAPVSLAACVVLAIQLFYVAHLGHGPDWRGFLEFSALYSNEASLHVPVRSDGPGWLLILLFTSLAMLAVVSIRHENYRPLAILATVWAAVWGMSLYYAGEAFNNHVNSLVPIFAFAWAIVAREFYGRQHAIDNAVWLAKLSFVPMLIILLATTLGEPRALFALSIPGMPQYHADVTSQIPTVNGDLETLFEKARITTADRVLVPNRESWVKLDNGMILPFVLDANGQRVQLRAWLPMSPVGAYNALATLPPARRHIYIERFLSDSRQGGWYITFREPASCERLSAKHLHTALRIIYKDYIAADCSYQ